MNPIFENILRGFAPHVPRPEAESTPYLDALEPRTCACGEPTGSVALDTCEECEGLERAARVACGSCGRSVATEARHAEGSTYDLCSACCSAWDAYPDHLAGVPLGEEPMTLADWLADWQERPAREAGLALEDVSEYDSAAEWCARRGIAGSTGDPLPAGLSASVADAINADADAFRERVRETAYGLAMEDTCRRSIRDASVDHARSVADLYDDGGAR